MKNGSFQYPSWKIFHGCGKHCILMVTEERITVKVSATLQSAIFRYLGFLHSQIDLFESFLLQKKSEKNIISVKRYRGQKILSC